MRKQSSTLPKNWRDRLPAPPSYYQRELPDLRAPNHAGWGVAHCCFHEDKNPSLSVLLVGARGLYRCFSCGAHGDMVTFHMQRHGLSFADAVRDLMCQGGLA